MKRLLTGVRVIDFTWIGAGSYTTKLLADLGADVIKIETSKRLDSLRVAPPYKNKIPGVNRSGYFADRNSSKRSITINIKTDQGLALVKRLIKQAHVVTNNFTPGVMDKLGLGYDVIRDIKPDVIYLAMSMQGATGPEMNDLGYGLTIGAVTGLQHLTGLPDRDPAGTGTNYPDHIPNPTHAAFSLIAALRHQRRTGQGQLIDIAQTEPTLAMIGPSIMNYMVNGKIDDRQGNSHSQKAPHGVYPCNGTDRWIAITVNDDDQWQALRNTLGIADKQSWLTMPGRVSASADLDADIARHTKTWESEDLMSTLQRAGVPAGVVNDARDVLENDAQLQARGHWVELDHPEMGPSTYNSAPFRFSDAESAPLSPAPLLGQHTYEICTDMLGMDKTEVDQLIKEDVLV